MGARTGIVLGAVGMLVGVAMAAGPRDSETGLGLLMGLILLGLSVWHARSWGLGKLAGMGLLALSGLLVHLADFGDGEWVWDQDRTGADLVGSWVVIVSGVVVLGATMWSLVAGVAVADHRRDEVTASLAFWGTWWMLVAAALAAVWLVGILTADVDDSSLEGETRTDAIPDEWSVVTHLGNDGGSFRDVHMVTTLSSLGEDDIEGLGGRLVWADAELELCGVEVVSSVEGAVQVGGHFPNTEQCEPAMVEAFDEHGLPETGCLYVRVEGVEDEHCAPLVVDERELDREG